MLQLRYALTLLVRPTVSVSAYRATFRRPFRGRDGLHFLQFAPVIEQHPHPNRYQIQLK